MLINYASIKLVGRTKGANAETTPAHSPNTCIVDRGWDCRQVQVPRVLGLVPGLGRQQGQLPGLLA